MSDDPFGVCARAYAELALDGGVSLVIVDAELRRPIVKTETLSAALADALADHERASPITTHGRTRIMSVEQSFDCIILLLNRQVRSGNAQWSATVAAGMVAAFDEITRDYTV